MADWKVRPPLIPWSNPYPVHPVYPCSIPHLGNLRLHSQLAEDLPQGLVRLLSLFFNRIQVRYDFRQRTVGLGFTREYVTAGRDVVVVFLQLRMIDDAAEFFLFLPAYQSFRDAVDTLIRDEVLWIALFEDLAGVDE